MSIRVSSSALRLGESLRVPSSVFTIQPKISLVVFQSLSPWSAFFRLTESFIYLGRERKISLRARRVSSETCCCCVLSPCVADRRLSIYTSVHWRRAEDAVGAGVIEYAFMVGG